MELIGLWNGTGNSLSRDGAVDEPALHPAGELADRIGHRLPYSLRHDGRGFDAERGGVAAGGRDGGGDGGGPGSRVRGLHPQCDQRGGGAGGKLAKVHGLTGLLTANPYYNRPGQEGQYQHFRAIAEAVKMPCCSTTFLRGRARTWSRRRCCGWRRSKNVVGIKESSGNMAQITELLTQAPRGFKVFAGDDGLALPVLALGGAGLISVASNAIPGRRWRRWCGRRWRATGWTARRINRQFFGLMQAHFWEPSPAPVKAVLALLGRIEEMCCGCRWCRCRMRRTEAGRMVGELECWMFRELVKLRMF
jgi:4-hydroxy-tetrahydrodipicolinate synthase